MTTLPRHYLVTDGSPPAWRDFACPNAAAVVERQQCAELVVLSEDRAMGEMMLRGHRPSPFWW